jgi:Ulp1 family protease
MTLEELQFLADNNYFLLIPQETVEKYKILTGEEEAKKSQKLNKMEQLAIATKTISYNKRISSREKQDYDGISGVD